MSKAAVQAIQDEKLLAAAAWLFRRKGFAATTLREIAQAAGMLLGSVHYRYSTKDALLLALMERGIEHAIAAVQTAAAQSVLLYEWRALSGPARDEMVRLRDRYEAFWDGMLYEAAGAGRVRPGVDLKLVRLYGFGAVNWVATWYTPGGERTPEQIADAFWAYLALGLLADDKRPGHEGVIVRWTFRELSRTLAC